MATINNDVDKILIYCYFNSSSNCSIIAEYGKDSFEDIIPLTEKDIGNFPKVFSERTVAKGRIIFGLHQTNLLKSTVQWVQDLHRISRDPPRDFIEHNYTFKENIDAARARADICRHNSGESDILSKVLDPEKLKKQKYCITW